LHFEDAQEFISRKHGKLGASAKRAISSGAPTRPSGTLDTSAAFLSGVPVKRLSIAVSVGPGATALTRTPKAPASSAADFVMPSTACSLAA
jgi:hypothetical protein